MELICNPVYVVLVDDSAESGENEMSDASVMAEFTVGEGSGSSPAPATTLSRISEKTPGTP